MKKNSFCRSPFSSSFHKFFKIFWNLSSVPRGRERLLQSLSTSTTGFSRHHLIQVNPSQRFVGASPVAALGAGWASHTAPATEQWSPHQGASRDHHVGCRAKVTALESSGRAMQALLCGRRAYRISRWAAVQRRRQQTSVCPTVSHHTVLVRPRVARRRLAAPSRPPWPSSVVRCERRKRIGKEWKKNNVMNHWLVGPICLWMKRGGSWARLVLDAASNAKLQSLWRHQSLWSQKLTAHKWREILPRACTKLMTCWTWIGNETTTLAGCGRLYCSAASGGSQPNTLLFSIYCNIHSLSSLILFSQSPILTF